MSFMTVQVNRTWETGQLDASRGSFRNQKPSMVLHDPINVDDWHQENPVYYQANCLAETDPSIIYYCCPG